MQHAGGACVWINTLSPTDAESILSKASELPVGVELPEVARKVIPLCGGLAMFVAFLRRRGAVRKIGDFAAWSEIIANIRTELTALNIDSPTKHTKKK